MTPHTTFDTLLEQATGPAEFAAAFMDHLGLAGIFKRMDIAEEEIAAARKRHPDASDQLYHSFLLLVPSHERMEYEPVYRSHCRELLDRVAAGGDPRLGTAAEVCCALHDTSLIAPLRSAASGLYFRMWRAAGLPDFHELIPASEKHEALEGSRIDDHESETRRKLTDPTRTLDSVECRGMHHGERVICTLAPAPTLLDTVNAEAAS
ncbi:hypothetical protein [Glycomyces harbinensis]|uniref:Uncharacterized protein n=1 Tax=Glycomyces harbinensis TaxID=58114 RepID=A0A1G6YBL7_9ACTN|nr:hypothetical protein [Glycomyces harbinensis]SDD87393.1 hypothetical protein SAMN05216270_108228 [Glycomyces harbinensis]